MKGLEKIPEGGERCFACFALRLKEAARLAAEKGFDFFTTTLTISPLKNAAKINEIGQQCAEESGVVWLPTDFKKKEGYKRSIELSADFTGRTTAAAFFPGESGRSRSGWPRKKRGRKVD